MREDQNMENTANYDAWQRIASDPEVVAAHAALDAHEAEQDRLTLELGRALRRARVRVFPSGHSAHPHA